MVVPARPCRRPLGGSARRVGSTGVTSIEVRRHSVSPVCSDQRQPAVTLVAVHSTVSPAARRRCRPDLANDRLRSSFRPHSISRNPSIRSSQGARSALDDCRSARSRPGPIRWSTRRAGRWPLPSPSRALRWSRRVRQSVAGSDRVQPPRVRARVATHYLLAQDQVAATVDVVGDRVGMNASASV